MSDWEMWTRAPSEEAIAAAREAYKKERGDLRLMPRREIVAMLRAAYEVDFMPHPAAPTSEEPTQ
jgi:hypothetical protein